MNGIIWTRGLRALYGGTSSNTITAGSIQTIAGLVLGSKNNASGVISLIDYGTGDEALLQNFSSNLYIDMKIASKSINIGTISASTNINIGSATSSNIIAGATTTSGLITANAGIISTTLKANTGTSSTTYLPAGTAPIVYYLRTNGKMVTSLTCGSVCNNDGVLSLESLATSGGTILQTNNGNTYLDCSQTLNTTPQAINIGTITPFQNINIGSSTSAFNLTSNQINYKGTSWNNVVSTTSTTFSKTSGLTTSYTKLGISATILARNLPSRFKITFNISALYFGVAATNHCFTIGTTIKSVDCFRHRRCISFNWKWFYRTIIKCIF